GEGRDVGAPRPEWWRQDDPLPHPRDAPPAERRDLLDRRPLARTRAARRSAAARRRLPVAERRQEADRAREPALRRGAPRPRHGGGALPRGRAPPPPRHPRP